MVHRPDHLYSIIALFSLSAPTLCSEQNNLPVSVSYLPLTGPNILSAVRGQQAGALPRVFLLYPSAVQPPGPHAPAQRREAVQV